MRGVARRYAKALAMVCREKGLDFDEVYSVLEGFTGSLVQDELFYRFLTTPVVSQKDRFEAAKEYVEKAGLPWYLENFFLLLVEKGRVSILPMVVEEFRSISDEMRGQVRGVLKVAYDLPEEEIEALQEVFSQRMGKKVVLSVEKDPSIIGGAVAYIGGVVFDGSIVGNLRSIKEKLVER